MSRLTEMLAAWRGGEAKAAAAAPPRRRERPQVETRPRGSLLPLLLAIGVIASAVLVVQVKQHNRDLTARLNTLQDKREKLDLEWSQLQLEQATLGGHGRVEQLARSQLDMVEPKNYVIVEAPK